jgi:Holliday junction resolvase RusA-like endonuclease
MLSKEIKSVEFFIRCVPPKTTAQQKGAFYSPHLKRIVHFKKKEVVESESDYMSLLAPHVPGEPLRGAVKFTAVFVWPFRKAESKRNKAKPLVPMDVKPDFDNLAKTLCDVLTKLRFWEDDANVTDGRVVKFWGANPGVYILAHELNELNFLNPDPVRFDRINLEMMAAERRLEFNDDDLFGAEPNDRH